MKPGETTMSTEEALGRIARAKENTIMAQKGLKELWGVWMERETSKATHASIRGLIHADSVNELRPVTPDEFLSKVVDRLELALHDVKIVRDNLQEEK